MAAKCLQDLLGMCNFCISWCLGGIKTGSGLRRIRDKRLQGVKGLKLFNILWWVFFFFPFGLGFPFDLEWHCLLHQVTSATPRSWAMTVSSSTRSRWQPGTAARRGRCTAFPFALTSSLSANPAGKVGLHHFCVCGCVPRFQEGLTENCLNLLKRKCNYLCVITWVCTVCVCQHGGVAQCVHREGAWVVSCEESISAHRNTDAIICILLL